MEIIVYLRLRGFQGESLRNSLKNITQLNKSLSFLKQRSALYFCSLLILQHSPSISTVPSLRQALSREFFVFRFLSLSQRKVNFQLVLKEVLRKQWRGTFNN
jgi:hypothetical protein